MNRQISYNWIKEFLRTDATPAVFAREMSLKSMTVDRVEKVKPVFKGVITAQILEISKHPNADKLKLVKVDAGKIKPTVVCGATNIKVGQIVPLATEGAKVQNPVEAGKTFTVKKAKIRDVESRGMMCSQKELGLGEDHQGIMILPDKTPVGVALEEVLALDDYILDVEITSNRPDAMSVVGLAREAAAVLGTSLKLGMPQLKLDFDQEIPLSIENEEAKLCPRYQSIVMTDVKVEPSPLWLQLRLMQSGIRPINNMVDITNYILLEYGKPMHVFDYDKLANTKKEGSIGKEIIIRKAKNAEKILVLDGQVYKLEPHHLVIADAKRPIAIGGVMGGEETGVDEKTKTIVFETAVFNPVMIRKTARELNLHSESSDLFERGLHPESTFISLLQAIELTKKLAKGKVAGPIIDICSADYKPTKIKFDTADIKRHLGIEIETDKVKNILESLGFEVSGQKVLGVKVPWWREGDVAYDYDLIEEVARIYGYHNLPTELPTGEIPVTKREQGLKWEDRAKDWLAGLGFTEVYNYSMVSKELLHKVSFSAKESLRIDNPLNEEMEYMRPTLIAQILQNVADNLNSFPEQHLFELSNIYLVQKENSLPTELSKLTGAIISQDSFLKAKGVVKFLLKKLGVNNYKMELTDPKCPLWQKDLALDVYKGKQFIGQFGLVKQNILDKFDIKKPVALFDFDFLALAKVATTEKNYEPIPEFPGIERDLAIVIDQKVSWLEVSQLVAKTDKLIVEIEYLSTFVDISLGKGKKSLAFRMTFRSPERTLKSEEVDEIIKKLVRKLEQNFQARLR